MRQGSLRTIIFAVSLLVAVLWAIGSAWYVSESWPVRHAKARADLAREEVACGNRSASPANQQRCRDLAEIMNRAELAESYFIDGVVVVGPMLVIVGVALWLRRGARGGRKDHHGHPHRHKPTEA
jgi:hypothetical protein